jgi:hypothetical protein
MLACFFITLLHFSPYLSLGISSNSLSTSPAHHSYWNYTTETSHMRYDVIGACDVTSANSSNPCPGGDVSQTNLFHYEAGLAWSWLWPTDGNSWEDGFNCTIYSVNITTFECVPSDFKPTGYINLAGVDV